MRIGGLGVYRYKLLGRRGEEEVYVTLKEISSWILLMKLRLLTECFILIVSAMFGATLTWLHVSDYHNFWNLKNSSLKINSLPLNDCFSHTNVLQNGVSALSKWFLKTHIFFLSKSLNFCSFRTIGFGSKFESMWSKYVSNNLWGDF